MNRGVWILVVITILFAIFIKTPHRPAANSTRPADAKSFAKKSVAFVENVLPENTFARLRSECDRLADEESARSSDLFAAVRRGGMITTDKLKNTKFAHALYRSREMQSLLKRITGLDLNVAPEDDKTACSLLSYTEPGDHIARHTDPSHFLGERIVVLLCLVNSGPENNGLSSSIFRYLDPESNTWTELKMPPNSLLIFRGSDISHEASGIEAGERRLLLSMTYCDVCKPTVLGNIVKVVKETVLGI